MKEAIPYPAINNVLSEWVRGVKRLLGENLIGLYLSGSLAYGDFVPERSDIDLQAVVQSPLTQDELRSAEERTKTSSVDVPSGQTGLNAPTFLWNSCAN